MQLKSKTIQEHLKHHQRRIFIRAAIFSVFLGLPVLIISLSLESKRTAKEIVEAQRPYIQYLLSTNDFLELQRSLNSIASAGVIYQVVLVENQGTRTLKSVQNSKKFFNSSKDSILLELSGGTVSYTLTWFYQVSWPMIVWVVLITILVGVCLAIFLRLELKKISLLLAKPFYLMNGTFRGISKVQQTADFNDLAISDYSEINDLQYEIKELFKRLTEAEKLVVKMAEKDAFARVASHVAHDIRSPISALNLLLRDVVIDNEKRKLLEAIVHRINNISIDLLKSQKSLTKEPHTYSDVRNPSHSNEQNVCNIVEAIEKIFIEKKTQYRLQSNINFELKIDVLESKTVRIDESSLTRVISNLINNSVEALVSGAGTIVIGIREHRNNFVIYVQDNGKGMSEDILKKIGEYGFSTGKEGFSDESGFGLGMNHAFQTARNYNGRIEVFSKVQVGTLVNVFFPKLTVSNESSVLKDFDSCFA